MMAPLMAFTAEAQQSFTLKWSRSTGLSFGTGIGPLAVDVTGDGIPEVFVSGDRGTTGDKIYCLDGRTGAVRWVKTLTYSIQPHCPMMIYDVNGDGQYEILQGGPNGMEALHAESGNVLWRNSQIKCGEEFQGFVANGHRYLYTCNGVAEGWGRLRKVDAATGQIVITKMIYHPCHGGISAADVNKDGKVEIFTSDRNTGGGTGITCWDNNLNKLWSRQSIACSSLPPILYDVNKDSYLEVVVPQRRDMNAGLYVLNARTGANIAGKCQDAITGMAVHEAMPIADIDGDGRLEIATCCSTVVRVFDIGRWQFDASLVWAGKSPYYANVIGDSRLEIVLSDGTNDIKVYDNGYHLAGSIPGSSAGSTVQDIDGDGLNELIVCGGNGAVRAYNTLAQAASPRPRTNINNFNERNTRAAVYVAAP
jgi:outer membrane protein assembly factor BamB